MKVKFPLVTGMLALMLDALNLSASQNQPTDSKDQVRNMVQNAKTPADHLKIAKYYRKQAKQLRAAAQVNASAKANAHYYKQAAEKSDSLAEQQESEALNANGR